jgi:hypothetical protein
MAIYDNPLTNASLPPNYTKVMGGNQQSLSPTLTQGGAFVVLTEGDVVVSNDSITSPMWSNNDPTLTVFYTSSTQISSNVQEYYTSVYQTASTEASAEIQFDIAYGDLVGSGSQFLNNLVTGSTPTRTNYGQYRNLVLGDENASFVFGGVTSSYWYAMPIERARYKQSILPGTWTLCLQGFASTCVTTVINTDVQLDLALTQTVVPANYSNIVNADIVFCDENGVAIDTSANNPTPPTFTGNIDLQGLTATGFTSIQFIAGSGTNVVTNVRVGDLIKILGTGVGGADGVNDIFIRINPSFINGTSKITLTDDSKLTTTTTFSDAGPIYQLVSGSAGALVGNLKNVNGYTSTSGSYGYLLPDINTLILNGEALDAIPEAGGINFGTSRSFDAKGENTLDLVNALNRGGAVTGFTINSKEDLSSDFIFCRAKNSEYNYSANPSFISSSTGAVLFPSFVENPTTYITTVGLYNVSQELLAVAKLSRPLEKNFTKELLVRVKLDF